MARDRLNGDAEGRGELRNKRRAFVEPGQDRPANGIAKRKKYAIQRRFGGAVGLIGQGESHKRKPIINIVIDYQSMC